MKDYTTVKHFARYTFEERKSEFIGHVMPVSTEEEAIAFVKKIKAEYPDAKHNVYAYVVRENSLSRYSDDHEPQGTAGLPVLDVIRKSGCTDVAIVVTRYFGGILLGTGGLVRAYTQAAKEALTAAEITTYRMHTVYSIKCSYSDYNKIVAWAADNAVVMENAVFADRIEFSAVILNDKKEWFEKALLELCNGRAEISVQGERYSAENN